MLSPDLVTCVGALKQLEELIKDKEKVQIMSRRMDQLMSHSAIQYKNTLNR